MMSLQSARIAAYLDRLSNEQQQVFKKAEAKAWSDYLNVTRPLVLSFRVDMGLGSGSYKKENGAKAWDAFSKSVAPHRAVYEEAVDKAFSEASRVD